MKRRGSRRGGDSVDPAQQVEPVGTAMMSRHDYRGRGAGDTTTSTPPESPDPSRSPSRTYYPSTIPGTTSPTTTTTTARATRRGKGGAGGTGGGGTGGKTRRSTAVGNLGLHSPRKTTTAPLTMEEVFERTLTESAIRKAAGNLTTRQLREATTLALVIDTSKFSVEGVWDAAPNLHTLTLDGSRLLSFRDLGVCLRHLNTLSLESSCVEDLDGIGVLSGLRELHLAHNRISDVTPLACHGSLQILGLEWNRVSDMNALGILRSLPLLYRYVNIHAVAIFYLISRTKWIGSLEKKPTYLQPEVLCPPR